MLPETPSITLLQAMALAQDRDSIAREYVTGFAITFEIGLPAMKECTIPKWRSLQCNRSSFPDYFEQSAGHANCQKKGN